MVQEQNNFSQKAKKYSLIKYTLSALETIFLLFLIFSFTINGFSKHIVRIIESFAGWGPLLLAIYLSFLYIGYAILTFPFSIYRGYILEHKFSLSRQSFKEWFLDYLKGQAISFLISLLVVSVFYILLKTSAQLWWLYISLFWIFFSIVLAKLLPIVIIPLFFKYKNISDGALKDRILRLAEKMKIRLLDIFEIDFSRKTAKANAALVGWGKTKRVILADTLKDKYTYDEIEVILAHEFAHFRLKHLIKLILINSLVTLSVFYFIYKTNSIVLGFFGFASISDIAALPVIFLYFVFFSIIFTPLQNYLSRMMERNADKMAIENTVFKDAFISLMEKLSTQNLSDRNPNPIIKFFFFDHPPIDERIRAAKAG